MLTFVCQVLNTVGYLLVFIIATTPLYLVYFASFAMSIGGGNTGFMSIAFSYCSDISSEKERTSKISLMNSLWYLGGPAGTFMIGFILRHSTYTVALYIMLGCYSFATLYIVFIIKESNGPFSEFENLDDKNSSNNQFKKEDVNVCKMAADFVKWGRVKESFKTLFKKRNGNDRAMLLTAVACNMVRRAARG